MLSRVLDRTTINLPFSLLPTPPQVKGNLENSFIVVKGENGMVGEGEKRGGRRGREGRGMEGRDYNRSRLNVGVGGANVGRSEVAKEVDREWEDMEGRTGWVGRMEKIARGEGEEVVGNRGICGDCVGRIEEVRGSEHGSRDA